MYSISKEVFYMAELKKNRIYQQLLEKIISGSWPAGMKLPAEPELCRSLGVARVTLRSALIRLTKEGVLKRSRPEGTIVLGTPLPRPKVLIIIPDPSQFNAANDYQRGLLAGTETRIRELNMEPEQIEVSFLPERLVHPEQYCGIIVQLSNFCGNEEILRKIRALGLPAVISHGMPCDAAKTGFACITTDARRAWLDGLRHLVDRGHKKIILLLMEWFYVESRMNFTEKELPGMLRSVGLDPEQQTVALAGIDCKVEQPLREALKKSPDATALYCYSDYYALRSYPVIRSVCRKIPKDLAVMGFSAQSGSALMIPPLSTVDFNFQRSAHLAVDLLVRIKRGERPRNTVIVSPYEILARESTENIIY